MNISKEAIIYIYLFISVISLVFLWTAGQSIATYGKSKTRIKKINKDIQLYKRLLLLYPIEKASKKAQKQTIVQRIYWFYLMVFCFCLIILLISYCYPPIDKLVIYGAYLKLLLIDLPILIYSFIMTKHGKTGGVVWEWEENH